MKTISIIGIISILILSGLIWHFNTPEATIKIGSVAQSSEYQGAYNSPQVGTQTRILKDTTGALGSVIITGANTGSLKLYNSTTTDATKRALATTSLPILAAFSTSATAGTYTFDTIFTEGLIADWTGNISTSTITWR